MDSPMVWAGIWLAVAATLGIGEILVAGSFFLAPFAGGALLAALTSLFMAPVWLSWLVFIFGSLGCFFLLRPLADRLDIELPDRPGFGANRLVGMHGIVTTDISVGLAGHGEVKVGGEAWKAEGRDGMGLPAGTAVQIVEVKGTRLIVEPAPAPGLTSSSPGIPGSPA